MNTHLLQKLNFHYKKANLDIIKAARTWGSLGYSQEDIQNQVNSDIGRSITAQESEDLYHISMSMQSDYEIIARDYEVSKGREDLIPDNIKQNKVKLSPSIRMAMDRVGANLFRHKTAKTYWTMKEKLGDNGEKAIYLVAVDEPDEVKKEASSKDDWKPGFRHPKTRSQMKGNGATEVFEDDLPENISINDIKGRSKRHPKNINNVPNGWDDKYVSDAGKNFKDKPKEKNIDRESIRFKEVPEENSLENEINDELDVSLEDL